MKKLLISLFLIIISASISACGNVENASSHATISNFENISKQKMQSYAQQITISTEQYYKAIISTKQEFPQIPLALSENCKKYLMLKFKYESRNNNKDDGKNYIEGEYKIANHNVVNNRIIFTVEVAVRFQYLGTDSTSYYTDNLQIVIGNPQAAKIVDWYNGDPASFDSITRNHNLDLENESNLLEKQNVEQILYKAQELLNKRFKQNKRRMGGKSSDL